jgi:S-adenosylmethionine hydrolase
MALVTFLSDYGLGDDFVGVCHGVIAQIAPDVRVIDVSHGIARHDVRAGALVLRRALEYLPPGVHLAVVDPGVGAQRRAVALRCGSDIVGDGPPPRLLVGPDNGLLWLAAEHLGGVREAADIGGSPLRRAPVSATFHGRDIFAPVAAHLAAGTPLAQVGEPLDPAALVRLELPRAHVNADGLVAHVLHADRYGNLMLDAHGEDLTAVGLHRGEPVMVGRRLAHFGTTFSDVPPGELLLYEDSYGVLSLAVNRGSALRALGLGLDDAILLAPLA